MKSFLRAVALVALVATGMTTLALPAAPVSANAYGDNGGSGSVGNDVTLSKGNVYCRNGEGWVAPDDGGAHYKWYDYPFTQCPTSQIGEAICTTICRLADNTIADYFYEPTHVEVWRFYGTRANPVQYWSASRVNFAAWGADNVPLVFFSPHPNDANGTPEANRYVAPFQIFPTTNRYREPVVVARWSGGGAFGTAFTTLPPHTRSSGSCKSLRSSDNPYQALDSWAQTDLAARYNQWQPQWGAAAAMAMANLQSMAPMAYDDGLACSSGVEFARPKSVLASNPDLQPVYGSCWIPVERRATNFTSATTGQVVQNFGINGGHRYDNTRYPKNSTSTYEKNGSVPRYHTNWRNQIKAEVQSRYAPDLYPASSGGGNFTPGDPYYKTNPDTDPNRLRRTSDRARAAQAAADHAHCADGPLSAAEDTGGGDPVVGDATVTVTTTSPQVFNVTAVGSSQLQRVSAVSHSFTCTGDCDDPDLPSPFVVSMFTRATVTGTNGYNGFDVVAQRSAGRLGRTSYVDLRFFSPTRPDQKVQVRTDAEGIWRLFTEKVTVTVPACNTCPDDQTLTIEYFVWEDKPLGIIHEGSPVQRPVYGASATWRD
jgi:hypothetical protein